MAEENKTDTEATPSSGVEALIDRLVQDGVEEGRARAQEIVQSAERRADWLLKQAREEAERIRARAREDAERLRRSTEEALHVAARDTVLELNNTLVRGFTEQLRRLIASELDVEAFLRQLILEVAGRAREQGGLDKEERVEVVLPTDVVGLEDLRRDPEELRAGTLTYFAAALGRERLREGVAFSAGEPGMRGIRIRLAEQDVEIDLTEEAVMELLLQHLQPRFRALLEGVVR
ncbi:MAG: hypothetical protein J5I81_00340 [Nitrococcus mobilis]|nr:hypothetical protein [Nitrococcus mobilis]